MWQLSQLDVIMTNLVNSGSWLYDSHLDIELLKSSLETTLLSYPVFKGRLGGEGISLDGTDVAFQVASEPTTEIASLKDCIYIPLKYKAPFNVKSFKKGEIPALSVKVFILKDGSLVSVSVSHTCADGATLYGFMHDWAEGYCKGVASEGACFDVVSGDAACGSVGCDVASEGSSSGSGDVVTTHCDTCASSSEDIVTPCATATKDGVYTHTPILDQSLFPSEIMELKELFPILQGRKWSQMSLGSLFPLIKSNIQEAVVPKRTLFIPNSYLNKLKSELFGETHISRHALLSAVMSDILFDKNDSSIQGNCKVVSVANLRGRVFPKGFVGNCVINIQSGTFDPSDTIKSIAECIDNSLHSQLSDTQYLTEYFNLYYQALSVKAPFVSFDLIGSVSKHLRTLMVNDFLGFKVYDICFGGCTPIKAYPNDLSGTLKYWEAPPSKDGVYILLKGNLAKRIKSNNEYLV